MGQPTRQGKLHDNLTATLVRVSMHCFLCFFLLQQLGNRRVSVQPVSGSLVSCVAQIKDSVAQIKCCRAAATSRNNSSSEGESRQTESQPLLLPKSSASACLHWSFM